MDETKLFDGDNSFRRELETERIRQKRRRREVGIDQSIRDAQQRGDFDDLPGKGKPLKWDSGHDDEHWLSNHMLKNAGFVPAWIEDGKRIEAAQAALSRDLDSLRVWTEEKRPKSASGAAPAVEDEGRWLEDRLRRREASLREQAEALNGLIDRFNLEVPIPTRQLRRLRIDDALDAIRATWPS